jgi:hypothetical protein
MVMKVAMRPRDVVHAPNWTVLVLSLASICFVYAIFGWSGVAFIGGVVAVVISGVVAVVVSLLIALNRRQ